MEENKHLSTSSLSPYDGRGEHAMSTASALGRVEMKYSEMKEILNMNSELRGKFVAFVKSKFAEETLLLYDACVAYSEAVDGYNELGHDIIEKFIKDDAEFAVDILDGLKKVLIGLDTSGQFSHESFDKLRVIALERLQTNFFHQFADLMEKEEGRE